MRAPEDVRIEDGVIRISGAEEMSKSLREIAEIAYGEPDRLPPGMEAGLEAQYRYTPPPMTFTSAAHACIVEVDAETGFVKIKRWISSEDGGVMINPAVVEGQIAGGLAQAIGSVLLEEIGYDARGNPTTVTYKDYMLPAICDVPEFELHASVHAIEERGRLPRRGRRRRDHRSADAGQCHRRRAFPVRRDSAQLPLTPSKILDVIEGRPISHKASGRNAGAVQSASSPETASVLPGGETATAPESAASATAVVDGKWKMVLATPMGPQQFTGHFATDGGILKGRLESDQGSQDFDGTVSGNTLKWDLKVTKPMAVTLKYDVQVEGDRLTGKVKMGLFGTSKLTGERM